MKIKNKIRFISALVFVFIPFLTHADTTWTANGSDIYNANAGNVGVGVTTPAQKLEVVGKAEITVDNTGDGTNSNSGSLIIRGTNTNQQLNIGYNTTSDFGFLQPGLFGSAYKNLVLNAAGGFVGIGTTSPTVPLSVTSVSNISAYFSGRVGIGLNNPAFPLDVAGKIMVTTDNIYNGDNVDRGSFVVRGASDNNKQFLMGYNTTSNYGFIQAAQWGSAYSNITINPNGGNLGVGTTTPTEKLSVQGNIKLTGNITSDGDICIGYCQ